MTVGTGFSTGVYAAILGHIVFLAVFVGWVVVVNRRGRREEHGEQEGEKA